MLHRRNLLAGAGLLKRPRQGIRGMGGGEKRNREQEQDRARRERAGGTVVPLGRRPDGKPTKQPRRRPRAERHGIGPNKSASQQDNQT